MSPKKSGEALIFSLGGHEWGMRDPEVAIASLKAEGLLADFIEDLEKEAEFLATLQDLIDRGYLEQTSGTPNIKLLEGTERLLELCKQQLATRRST